MSSVAALRLPGEADLADRRDPRGGTCTRGGLDAATRETSEAAHSMRPRPRGVRRQTRRLPMPPGATRSSPTSRRMQPALPSSVTRIGHSTVNGCWPTRGPGTSCARISGVRTGVDRRTSQSSNGGPFARTSRDRSLQHSRPSPLPRLVRPRNADPPRRAGGVRPGLVSGIRILSVRTLGREVVAGLPQEGPRGEEFLAPRRHPS